MSRIHSALVLLLAVGCAKRLDPEAVKVRAIVEKALPDGLVLQEVDINGDRRPDVFNTLRPRKESAPLLVKKELDLNLDGRIDVVTYYTDEGELEKEEMDDDFDGRTDWIDHYRGGSRVMSEVDANRDGTMDTFSYYEGNPPRIDRKERDTDGIGGIDTWERFDKDGNVIKTGRDTDGDGKMDVRDE